ncbi:MAG: helix-turn-helix domain-containing protein [Bacteroidaceae bacterium]|nr:helix-turn-helix domain-containing protein [Bacteroidaceae bacterium]
MKLRTFPPYLILLLCLAAVEAYGHQVADTCMMTKLVVKRLPDLNMPRGGHNTLFVNGELTVVGGHTSGFVPTPTAEYLSDGQWHLLETVYAHDHGFSLPTRSGRVLLGAGHEKPLGIGQVHHVEWYDPVAHTFDGFGCLDIRRVFAQAAELRDGTIAIGGNWYHHDSTEIFRQPQHFATKREVSLQRCFPFIFPTSDGDAIIMGNIGTRGENYDYPTIVDRIYGAPFDVQLLAEWRPMINQAEQRTADFCISDTAAGEYAYLMPVLNRNEEAAIVLVRDTILSLLPTTISAPTEGPWGRISFMFLAVDRKTTRAYLVGRDGELRFYVLAVEYAALLMPDGRLRPSLPDNECLPARLYYTDPQTSFGNITPVVTDEGDIAMAGGVTDNNFTPKSGVCLLCIGPHTDDGTASFGQWLWLLCTMPVAVALGVFLALRLHRRHEEVMLEMQEEEVEPQDDETEGDLLSRINQLMEEKKLYLQNDLKVADVSEALGISRRSISECIMAHPEYTSFAHFVNGYRVRHAKELLRLHPGMKIITIGLESGFSNEQSFFRTFKSFTGMTPREWLAQGE